MKDGEEFKTEGRQVQRHKFKGITDTGSLSKYSFLNIYTYFLIDFRTS